MSTLYLDIETCPVDATPGGLIPVRAYDATAEEALPPEPGRVPSNIRDPEKIAARQAEIDAAHRQALAVWQAAEPERHAAHRERALAWWGEESLDPIGRRPHLGGRVLCVGYAIDDEPVRVIGPLNDERLVLAELDAVIDDVRPSTVVGHNVRGFDAAFLSARALKLGVARAVWRCLRPVDRWGPGRHVVDTAQLVPVVGYGGRPTGTAKLSDWCAALGLTDTAQTGGGAEVLGWYLAGDTDLIAAHCVADVAEVRRLYRLITEGPAAEGRREVA